MNIRISAIALACLIGFSHSLAVDPRMEQGARFEAKGDFEMALGEYRAVLAEDPRNAAAYFAAAEVRVKMKDYSGALANYRLAYKFEPTMSEAYEGAAKVYEVLGQKSKADAERAKDPKNAPAPDPAVESVAAPEPVPAPKTATVKSEAVTSRTEAPAKAVAEKPAEPAAVKAAPSSADELFERGKSLIAEGRYRESAPIWREVLSKVPGHAGAYFYAGVTRFELGEFDKAEYNLKKGLEYREEGNDANFYLACVYQRTKRPAQEKKALNAYLKKAAPGAKFRREAESRLAELNAASGATETVAGQESAPVVKETKETAQVAERSMKPAVAQAAPAEESPLRDANLLFKAGKFEPALQMYRSLLDTDLAPEDRYFVMLQMGNAYRELRDFHSAVTRYREVVQQFPDSDWATEAERALEDAVWLEKHSKDLPARKR